MMTHDKSLLKYREHVTLKISLYILFIGARFFLSFNLCKWFYNRGSVCIFFFLFLENQGNKRPTKLPLLELLFHSGAYFFFFPITIDVSRCKLSHTAFK